MLRVVRRHCAHWETVRLHLFVYPHVITDDDHGDHPIRPKGFSIQPESSEKHNSYLPPRRVCWDGGNVLNSADGHTSTSQSTKGTLGTRSRSFCGGSTSSPELNVQSVDSNLLASDGDILGSQHGSVGRRLVTIGLDLHSTYQSACSDSICPKEYWWVGTSNTRNCFSAGKIGNMDECIVEGGVDVGDTENVLAISNLRAEGDSSLFLWGLGLFWRLEKQTDQNSSRHFTLENTARR